MITYTIPKLDKIKQWSNYEKTAYVIVNKISYILSTFYCPGLRPPADTWKSWNIQILERTAPSADDRIAKLAAVAHDTSNEVLVTVAVLVSAVVL